MALNEQQQARLLAMLRKAAAEAELREQAKGRHPAYRRLTPAR